MFVEEMTPDTLSRSLVFYPDSFPFMYHSQHRTLAQAQKKVGASIFG